MKLGMALLNNKTKLRMSACITNIGKFYILHKKGIQYEEAEEFLVLIHTITDQIA